MNMSYCRYENTLSDLRDCINDAVEHVNEEARYSVSKSEINCFREMVKEFWNFIEFCELIDYEAECLNEDELDEVCFKMEKGDDEDDD